MSAISVGVAVRPRTILRIAAAAGLGAFLALLVLVAVIQDVLDTGPGSSSAASRTALADIPADRLALYQQAGADRGIDWAILAAIGKVECDHGRSRLAGCHPPGTINQAGARGPMQFLGSTWRSTAEQRELDVAGPAIPEGQETRGFATDANGDGVADPWQPADAIHAAARMLRHNGAPDNYETALHAYNPSDRYVRSVLDHAARYRAPAATQGEFQGTPGNVPLADVACPAGGTTSVHAQLAPTVEALYAAAADQGHLLCGGGYRDPGRQIELRRQHCGNSNYAVYEMPSSQCSPPTARPGASMHERGLAIDLTCNGTLIRSRSNTCFGWLQSNAERYGLRNLPSEPWHWSTDGS